MYSIKASKNKIWKCRIWNRKIFVKELNQEEIRFVYFKDTFRKEQQLIARPLDLTEDELIKLIKESIKKNVFSKGFISNLRGILNTKEVE